MNTTVTVDDETRRRLKRLAAVLDETQGRIVRKAVALYESQLNAKTTHRKVPRRVLEELERASTTIRGRDARWAKVSEVIEHAAIPLEEFSPASWGSED